jgi:hypothetical protein
VKIRIEQEFDSDSEVSIKTLVEFTEAVEKAAGSSIQYEYECVRFEDNSLVYEREH